MVLSQRYEEALGFKGASGRHSHSNFVGASSLLRLHRAVTMAAVMVTSVPCKSHPSQGGGGGSLGGQYQQSSFSIRQLFTTLATEHLHSSGNPYQFASFTHLSYTRNMTWISYLEKVMTSYIINMTWVSQMQII